MIKYKFQMRRRTAGIGTEFPSMGGRTTFGFRRSFADPQRHRCTSGEDDRTRLPSRLRSALATADRACDKVASGLQMALLATIIGTPVAMMIMFTEPSEGKKGWLNLVWSMLVPAVLFAGGYLLWRYLPEASGGGSGGGGGGYEVCWDRRGGPYRC